MTTTLTVLQEACCAPVTRARLSPDQATDLARTLKAIADPARLRLLSVLADQPTGEACVCDLTGPLDLSQPTVSHHLRILTDAGVLARDKRGTWAYYSIVPGALETIAGALASSSPRTAEPVRA